MRYLLVLFLFACSDDDGTTPDAGTDAAPMVDTLDRPIDAGPTTPDAYAGPTFIRCHCVGGTTPTMCSSSPECVTDDVNGTCAALCGSAAPLPPHDCYPSDCE